MASPIKRITLINRKTGKRINLVKTSRLNKGPKSGNKGRGKKRNPKRLA